MPGFVVPTGATTVRLRRRADALPSACARRRRQDRLHPGWWRGNPLKPRHGGAGGGHGALGAGSEWPWSDGPLVLREQWPVALRARDAGAVPGPQQDARVPGAQCQGALSGLELRRASLSLWILRQDGQCVLAGEGPVGELLGPGADLGEGLWWSEMWGGRQ